MGTGDRGPIRTGEAAARPREGVGAEAEPAGSADQLP